MKKIAITIAGLVLPLSAFADVDTYSRSPSGTNIPAGDVNFTWQTSNIPLGAMVEQLQIDSNASTTLYGTCLPITGDPQVQSDTISVPEGAYTEVRTEYGATDCSSLGLGLDGFEGTGTSTVFSASSTESTTTPSVDHYKDYLFVSGVVIFLLAYPVWGRLLGKPSGL